MPLLRNRIDGGEPEVREELCHTRRLLPRLCLEPRPIAGETLIWTKGAKWRPHQLGHPNMGDEETLNVFWQLAGAVLELGLG